VSRARWLYDPFEERLFREDASGRHEVPLSPQQHRLVAFMAERNRLSGDKQVLCGREELIQAVWGDEQGHTPQDLAYLVHQLRSRLGAGADDPLPIVSERGRGYRLLLDAPSAPASTAAAAAGSAQGSVAAGTARAGRPRRFGWLVLAALTAVVVVLVGAANLFARPEPILREGSRGEDVLALQRDLAAAGYDPVYLDGQFGPLTARAVRAFQQDNAVVVDGEVGPETRAALRRALQTRAATPVTP
jgi:DNA-binding winged helix-turn-helix (wHTH) protein